MRSTADIPLNRGEEAVFEAIREFDGIGHPSRVGQHQMLIKNFLAAIGRAKYLRDGSNLHVVGHLDIRQPIDHRWHLSIRLRYSSQTPETEAFKIHKDLADSPLGNETITADVHLTGLTQVTPVWDFQRKGIGDEV
jgi:hypothetical protein